MPDIRRSTPSAPRPRAASDARRHFQPARQSRGRASSTAVFGSTSSVATRRAATASFSSVPAGPSLVWSTSRCVLEASLRQLRNRLPILWHGTVLDGELVAGRFTGTMSALLGSKEHGERLRYVVFGVPVLVGVDLRRLPSQERRERLELMAQTFRPPVSLSPLVEPSADLARQMLDGDLEGLLLKDRTSPYRDRSRAGWWKVKDHSWYEREAWRFENRR